MNESGRQASIETLAVEHFPATADSLTHILFCGGFHSSMLGSKATFVQQHCAARGWGYTRFDYRGHGQSPGAFENFTLTHWLDDTLQVLSTLAAPSIVIGSSMGAWLAVLAALREPARVRALLTLAAAPDFTEELIWPRLGASERAALANAETIELPTAHEDEPWRVREPLFASGRALALLGERPANQPPLSALRCPLHLIHGTADSDVPVAQSQRLFEQAGSADSSLLLLKGADHRLSDPASLLRIGAALDQLVASLHAAERA